MVMAALRHTIVQPVVHFPGMDRRLDFFLYKPRKCTVLAKLYNDTREREREMGELNAGPQMRDEICNVPLGGEGRGRPNEAMLQFALLPSITGFGLEQALLADSESRNVT